MIQKSPLRPARKVAQLIDQWLLDAASDAKPTVPRSPDFRRGVRHNLKAQGTRHKARGKGIEGGLQARADSAAAAAAEVVGTT